CLRVASATRFKGSRASLHLPPAPRPPSARCVSARVTASPF
ncbi:MAG: hypothetical protein AVDCRST_MAG86-1181, partial [uncultured Truepera sp.]